MAIDKYGLRYHLEVLGRPQAKKEVEAFKADVQKLKAELSRSSAINRPKADTAQLALQKKEAEQIAENTRRFKVALEERYAAEKAAAAKRTADAKQAAAELQKAEKAAAAKQAADAKQAAQAAEKQRKEELRKAKIDAKIYAAEQQKAEALAAQKKRANAILASREEAARARADNKARKDLAGFTIGAPDSAFKTYRKGMDALKAATDRGLLTPMEKFKGRLGVLDSFNRKLDRSNSLLGKLGIGFFQVARSFTVMKSIQGVVDGFTSIVTEAIRFSAAIETAEVGIASILASTGRISDFSGRQLTGSEKFAASQKLASQQMAQLRVDALQTTATFEELVDVFQSAVGPGLAAGLNVDQVRKFSLAVAQAAGSIGLPANQIASELRDILTGNITARNSRIATVLGITNEDVKRAREIGKLNEFLTVRFSAFAIAGKATQQTFAGILSNLRDAFSAVASAAASGDDGLFANLKKGLAEVSKLFVTVGADGLKPSPATVAVFKSILSVVDDIVKRMTLFVSSLSADDIKEFAKSAEATLRKIVAVFTGALRGIAAVAAGVFKGLGSFADIFGGGSTQSLEAFGEAMGRLAATVLTVTSSLSIAKSLLGSALSIFVKGAVAGVHLVGVLGKISAALPRLAAAGIPILSRLAAAITAAGGLGPALLGILPLAAAATAAAAAVTFLVYQLRQAGRAAGAAKKELSWGDELAIMGLKLVDTVSGAAILIVNSVLELFLIIPRTVSKAAQASFKAIAYGAEKFLGKNSLTALGFGALADEVEDLTRAADEKKALALAGAYENVSTLTERYIATLKDKKVLEERSFDETKVKTFADMLEEVRNSASGAREGLEQMEEASKALRTALEDARIEAGEMQKVLGLSGGVKEIRQKEAEIAIKQAKGLRDLALQEKAAREAITRLVGERARLEGETTRLANTPQAAGQDLEAKLAKAKELLALSDKLAAAEAEAQNALALKQLEIEQARQRGFREQEEAFKLEAVALEAKANSHKEAREVAKLEISKLSDLQAAQNALDKAQRDGDKSAIAAAKLKLDYTKQESFLLSDRLRVEKAITDQRRLQADIEKDRQRAEIKKKVETAVASKRGQDERLLAIQDQTGGAGEVRATEAELEQARQLADIRANNLEITREQAAAEREFADLQQASLQVRRQEIQLARNIEKQQETLAGFKQAQLQLEAEIQILQQQAATASGDQLLEIQKRIEALNQERNDLVGFQQRSKQIFDFENREARTQLETQKAITKEKRRQQEINETIARGGAEGIAVGAREGARDFEKGLPGAGQVARDETNRAATDFGQQAGREFTQIFLGREANFRQMFANIFETISQNLVTQVINNLIVHLVTSGSQMISAALLMDSAATKNLAAASASSAGGGLAKGGNVGASARGFSGGGSIGPRIGGNAGDTVPIWANPMEWIIRPEAVKKYGHGFMDAINRGALDPSSLVNGAPTAARVAAGTNGFAMGGPVSASAPSKSAKASGGPSVAVVAPSNESLGRMLNGGRVAMMDFIRSNRGEISRALG